MNRGLTYSFILFISIISSIVDASDQLILGIHPYKSYNKLLNAFTPLSEYLSKKTGKPVRIIISKDYQTHIEKIGLNKIDIAYMGPASYVKLINQYGKKPILACQAINGKPSFQGKIIIRKNSMLSSLSDLKGKNFAFGDANSTMSHLVPRYMLLKAGVTAKNLSEYKFLGSHDNVALAVLAGDFDAGAVKEAVFYKYKDRGLKTLATTPALSEHIFVTSNKLKPATINSLRAAFLSLAKESDGLNIMHNIKPGMTDMLPVNDNDYDNLREIFQTLQRTNIIK